MKTIKLIILLTDLAFAVLSVDAQTFQNMNFEQAAPAFVPEPAPYYPFEVTVASALPYWTVTIGGVQQTEITENDPSTGSTWVMLAGPGDNFGISPIDGNYSAVLQGGAFPGDAAISQTGLIPANSESLLFEARPVIAPATGPLDVLIGTQNVPFTAIATGPDYTVYSANISAWANQIEQLTFFVPGYSGNWEIDDIGFSTTPEPSIVALSAMGGLLFGTRKWFA